MLTKLWVVKTSNPLCQVLLRYSFLFLWIVFLGCVAMFLGYSIMNKLNAQWWRVNCRLQIVALSLKCVFVNLDNNQLRPQIKDFDINALITRSKMGSCIKPVGVSYWTGGRSKQRRTLKVPLCRRRLWCYRLFSVRCSPSLTL